MGMDVEMARLVAINTTQPITKEAATVRERMNTNIAVHSHNIFPAIFEHSSHPP
jgi:hypothetical protein